MWPTIHLGRLSVGTYGLLVTLGYLSGALWLRCNRWEMRAPFKTFWQLGLCIVFGAVAGAKLGFWIVEGQYFLADPMWMLRHWKMGWVMWSGFLGTMLMGGIYQRWHNRRHRPRAYLPVADYFAPAFAIGHVLGRFACFAQGCCYGSPTSLPWGVRFTDHASAVSPELRGVALHPVQLYEAAVEALFAAFLIRHVLPGIRAKRYTYGTAFLGWLCAYSVARFLLEFLRADDRGTFLWSFLSPSQWVSLAVLIGAGTILYRRGIYERDPAGRSIFLRAPAPAA
ncbi:MAG TPA: prolipoprotein diacylglyceryl transferase family protein [Elusimicrobiota bacterium]|jgi:phosphatidylglycerol:prolipoprotein diacylglycerol transferase|nr:prolipoprotein diacylglyceryl transferase family protein [Elusimicrobiota bacterium]